MKAARRLERAQALAAAADCRAAGQRERAAAAAVGRPRSTLRGWAEAQVAAAEVPAALAACCATVAGVRGLPRLVLAMQCVITLRAGSGVRLVCELLELSGLSALLGASYGSQQGLSAALEQAVMAVAGEQRAVLAAGMRPRAVAVCEDERFQPAICLVALEPVSGFIVLEQYAADRTAATWTQALRAACAGLPITMVPGTADAATALCRHIAQDHGAHHAPDLCHLQHEVVRATGLSLARAVPEADAEVATAEAPLQAERAAAQAYRTQRQGPGRPPALAQRIRDARATLARVTVARNQAQARQREAHALIRALGEA